MDLPKAIDGVADRLQEIDAGPPSEDGVAVALSWITAETMWALRRLPLLRDRFLKGLGHTVGMTTRVLLTPAA